MKKPTTPYRDEFYVMKRLANEQGSRTTVRTGTGGEDDSVSDFFHRRKQDKTAVKTSNIHPHPIYGTLKSANGRIRVPKRRHKQLKYFLQPPMWSTRPRPPHMPALRVTGTSKRKEKISTDTPRLPISSHRPTIERESLLLEREYDPYEFLEHLRKKALEFSKGKKYKLLGDLFTVAINKFPNNPSFHCNRSYAFQKMEYYGKALDDANKAIALNDHYKRAYHRRAAAYLGLGMIVNALEDFEQLMKLCPQSKKIKCKYLHCQNALKKSIFDSSISDNMSEHAVEHLVNYKTIGIEDSYDGPRLRTEKITTNFLATLTKYYQSGGILHRKYVYKILFEVEILMKSVPTLVPIQLHGTEETLIICGDIQGQYYDLSHIFERNGFPSNKLKYLFNGNFIGKGSFGVEVAILLFAYKLAFPDKIFLNRGHHETLAITKLFGFEKEVSIKYSPTMFQIFTRIFQWLPLAHCVNNKVLVLHGGLFSEDGVTLDHIRGLKRDVEPQQGDQKITDILWSDPQKEIGKQKNFRGMGGILFGPDVTEDFLNRNELTYIIRSHALVVQGITEHHNGKCITVFSAPNYCDIYNNKGSYVLLTGHDLLFSRVITEAQRHPDIPALHYADAIHRMLI